MHVIVGAMTAASNFFRRYTSANSQDGGVIKQSADQNETPLEWRILNEVRFHFVFLWIF